MEKELVNSKYIRELLDVTEDQKEFDLVSQLFQRLIASRDGFLKSFEGNIAADQADIAFQLHKLKNQFANLGCEAVSQVLENMYQLARNHQLNQVQDLMPKLRALSDETFQKLRSELNH